MEHKEVLRKIEGYNFIKALGNNRYFSHKDNQAYGDLQQTNYHIEIGKEDDGIKAYGVEKDRFGTYHVPIFVSIELMELLIIHAKQLKLLI